jgi:alkylation response protein AidB-like acyl-CoA dehydrogenase
MIGSSANASAKCTRRSRSPRALLMQSIMIVEVGRVPVHEAAMTKVFSSELMQRLGEAALDILGPIATLSYDAPGALLNGEIEQALRQSIMMIVGGGTNEIQRTLIAQRGLGLPR